MVQEAILNVRNFVIITSTLLNPDDNNLGIVLPPVLGLVGNILNNVRDLAQLQHLIPILKQVILVIDFAFRILYPWVSLA